MSANHSPAASTHSEEPLHISSDFLSVTAPEKKSVRLSSALLNYTRPPGINLISLGSSPALDIFARLHNGTRRELIDLYNMVDSMQRRIQEIRTSDMKMFFIWWNLFSSFLKTTFQVHNQILYPWISNKVQLPEPFTEQQLSIARENLHTLLKEFRTAHEQLTRRPPDETLARIIKGLVHMHQVVKYFEDSESMLPDLLEQNYDSKEIKKMEKKVASFFNSHGRTDHKRMHLLLVARGMSDEVLSAWNKILPTWVRVSYRTAKRRFDAVHLGTVRQLARE